MSRPFAEKNHNDWKKAIRKRKLCRAKMGMDWYKHLHQYQKNKIHCSCWMCREKTNQDNSYEKSHRMGKNWSVNDLRKIQSMLDGVIDAIENGYDEAPFYEPDWEDEDAFERAYDYQNHYDDYYECYADWFTPWGDEFIPWIGNGEYPCYPDSYADDDPWNY